MGICAIFEKIITNFEKRISKCVKLGGKSTHFGNLFPCALNFGLSYKGKSIFFLIETLNAL